MMKHMQLYYLPGSCALAVHIVLKWLNQSCEYIRLKRGETRNPEFLAINPAGKVPAFFVDGKLLTEAEAILFYLADEFPTSNLGPENTSESRFQFHRWMSYLTGDVHPAFYPHFNPQRYLDDEKLHESLRLKAHEQIARHFELLNQTLGENEWFLENRQTILDAYLFVFSRWIKMIQGSLDAYPAIKRHYQHLSQDQGVLSALEEENISV